MARIQRFYVQTDVALTNWMAKYGITLLRISVGIVFFWFGVLKFFPNLSPAEDLAARTVAKLTFNAIQPNVSVPVLAAWECLIGLGLLSKKFLRATLALLALQMLGTITPLFLFPNETFTSFPYAPTLEGQYIIKNIVLVSAGIVIGAAVRGGALIADPDRAERVQQSMTSGAARETAS
jgi:uncharacterized membrane protein YkgB